jgi:hypothetical protein
MRAQRLRKARQMPSLWPPPHECPYGTFAFGKSTARQGFWRNRFVPAVKRGPKGEDHALRAYAIPRRDRLHEDARERGEDGRLESGERA